MAKIVSFLASAALVIAFIPAAQAGFEWKGPLSPPEKAAPAAPSSSAQDAGGMTGLEPVVMWDGATAPAAATNAEISMPAEKVGDVERSAINKNTEALAPEELAAAVPAVPVEQEKTLSGFGSDLPMVIALQQVVPAGYQFSFSSGVNPGALVSWEGGKAWEQVLSDMLSAQGLGYKAQNNVVIIGYFPSEQKTRSAAVKPAKQAPEEVTIRRQKPSSFLKRQAETEAEKTVVAAAQETQPVPAAPIAITASADKAPPGAAVSPAVADDAAASPLIVYSAWSGARWQTLRDVLKNWSDVAGVELYWSIDYDYKLRDDVGYPGTYDEAVGKLLDLFSSVRPQPYGQLHQSGDGPRVLVVKSYDLTQ